MALCGVIIVLAIAVIAVGLFKLPWIDYTEEERAFKLLYDNLTGQDNGPKDHRPAFTLPVMSFNIRLDGWERDPESHFTRRLPRMRNTIDTWRPVIIGLQEPYGEQMAHMMEWMPKNYRVIGKHNRGDGRGHRGELFQRGPDDYQVAILYDSNRLSLAEHDYIHLSNTSKTDGSKDWNSFGVRTLNIARFNVLGTPHQVLAFNTHLDSRSEEARRGQALVLKEAINQWKLRYPDAIVVVTGDFNSIPGQMPSQILRESLKDSWDQCASRVCPSNDVAVTFHGWHGSFANTFASRIINIVLFTLHGMGMKLPHHVPTSWSEFRDFLSSSANLETSYSLWESLPSKPWSNLHVDWILYGESRNLTVDPKLSFVCDVREAEFSSDHFPLISLLQVSRKIR